MKANGLSTAFLSLVTIALLLGCSSSSSLRHFDEEDLGKEFSADAAKKFEVKDVTSLSPSPTPADPLKITTKKKKKKKAKPESVVAPTPAAFAFPVRRPDRLPFDVGEHLSYDIRFIGVSAGTFTLEVLPFKVVNDRKVFHFQAKVKTAKLFEIVYRVNDVVESFWDESGLFSHRYTMELDETKQRRKVIELYDYEKKKSFFWNRIDHVDKGFSENKEEYDIALWAQDPVSSLYYLRSVDLPTNPSQEYRFPVIIDGKQWESVVHFQKQEKMSASGQDFLANRYTLENYQNGELKNKDNTIWISADTHRYIMRVEAKVKVGSFVVALDDIL